ncbi:hypothetical protein ACFL3H_06015 [Gemmatimonadota bacterium]
MRTSKGGVLTSLVIALVICTGVSAQEASYPGHDIYPQRVSRMFQVKAGYHDDRVGESSHWVGSVRAEFRLKPSIQPGPKGGYQQLQIPISVYYFGPGEIDAFAFDVRFRLEMGPPIKPWIPLFFPEIGYLYNSKDWYVDWDADRVNHQTHSFLIGGVIRFYLKGLNNAVVDIGAGTAVLGDGFFRESCYMHWFLTDHFGITIHGDGFARTFNDRSKRNGHIVFGVMFK